MNYSITVPYPFVIDKEILTDKHKREAIKRFFDFNRWLMDNAIDRFEMDDYIECDGITIHFINEADKDAFTSYIATYFTYSHD